MEVLEFIKKHDIKNQTSFLVLAHEQNEQGKKNLARFILSLSSRSLDELENQTWKMKESNVQNYWLQKQVTDGNNL